MPNNNESDSDDSLHEIMAQSLITAEVNDNLEYNPSIAKALHLKQEEICQCRIQKQKMKGKKKKEKITSIESSTSYPNTGVIPYTLPKPIEIELHQPFSKRKSNTKSNMDFHNPTFYENEIPICEINSIVGVAEALISLKPS